MVQISFFPLLKKYRQEFLRDKQSVINDIVFDLDSDFINQYQYLSNLFDQEKPDDELTFKDVLNEIEHKFSDEEYNFFDSVNFYNCICYS